jgi:hypothetical protein
MAQMPKTVKDQISRLSLEWRDKLSRNEIIVAAQKSFFTEQQRRTTTYGSSVEYQPHH